MEKTIGLYLAIFVLGLCVGSFLNVVIHRLPLMIARRQTHKAPSLKTDPSSPRPQERFNLAIPGSHCIHCGNKIRLLDNIPIMSYLLLGGRCRECHARISPRYPIVEFLTAMLSTIPVIVHGPEWKSMWIVMATWLLLLIAFIDLERMLIFDFLVFTLLWMGLLLNSQGVFCAPEDAIIGAAAGYLFLWVLNSVFRSITDRSGMGHGDFKLLSALGAWLGWQALPVVVFIAATTGLVFGLVQIFRKRLKFGQPIPFGPWLALSGWYFLVDNDSFIYHHINESINIIMGN